MDYTLVKLAIHPYDNAPMERSFNTLKNELIYLHDYLAEDDLYASVDEFADGFKI